MKLPELKRIKRQPGYPETWEWIGHDVAIYRPRMSLVYPKKQSGALALLFEPAEYRKQKTFYVPWFETFAHANELLDRATELATIFEVHDVYSRLTQTERDFLRFFNDQCKHNHRLSVRQVPNADPTGKIDYFLNLLNELQQPDRERCFFPKESDIPRLLAEIPEMAHEVTDADFPAAACVAYGVAVLCHRETVEPEANWVRKTWDLWGPLKT
jgi:hypothetical protein